MPVPFATPTDLEAFFRPLTDAELEVARSLLAFASAIIRQQFTDVDTRITAGTLDADLVKFITLAATSRQMRNPEGWRQEAIEDFSRTRDSALSTGALYLTAEEVALLTPAEAARRGAFSIAPSMPVATYAQQEQAYAYQLGWREPYIVERRT